MENRLFGTKALEIWLNITLSAHDLGIGPHRQNWEDKNVQPKRKISDEKKQVDEMWDRNTDYRLCPHYELVELCAEIMGIKPKELASFEFFCGLFSKDIMVGDRLGTYSKKGGVEKIPFRSCETIKDLMDQAVRFAKSRKPVSIGPISDRPSKKEVKKIEKFSLADEKFKLGQEILVIWKETVLSNVNTRQGSRSKRALILAVEMLSKRLGEVAVGEKSISGHGAACSQAPKYDRKKWLYID